MQNVKSLLRDVPGAEILLRRTKISIKLQAAKARREATALRQSRRNSSAQARLLLAGDFGKLGSKIAEFWYEPFNIWDRYAHEDVALQSFIKEKYPDVPLREDFSDNHSLLSIAKAERVFGFKPSERRR